MKILFWIYIFIFFVFLGTVKIKDEIALEKEIFFILINLSKYNDDFFPNRIKKYLKDITMCLINSEDLMPTLNKFSIDEINNKKIKKIERKVKINKDIFLKANDFDKAFNFRFLSFDTNKNILTIKLISKNIVNIIKGDNELVYKLIYFNDRWSVVDIS